MLSTGKEICEWQHQIALHEQSLQVMHGSRHRSIHTYKCEKVALDCFKLK